MAKVNRKPQGVKTAEGAPAKTISADLQLKRSIMSCLLWEDSFYESGEDIADRIAYLCKYVDNDVIAGYAREARDVHNLRHVPLLLAVQLARKHYDKTAEVLYDVVQRADELAELLALYWKDGKIPVAAQVKKGLAKAFTKFNEYQLAKYNRDGAIKLRDVLFLSHAKPKDSEQAALWKRLINGEMATPDTWEVALSAGGNKRLAWERLIDEKKLGGLAFLRNMRNMIGVNVHPVKIREGLESLNVSKVLPFRFIAAARFAPDYEPYLEKLMFKSLAEKEKIPGATVLLVDVSGSMDAALSRKSDMLRLDAACGLAMALAELSEVLYVYTFSNSLVHVPSRRGFALADAIKRSQSHQGTNLGKAINGITVPEMDRIIVITDEQSHDRVPDPKGKGYMINVSTERHGVGYGKWVHIDGFSESIIDYIREIEKVDA